MGHPETPTKLTPLRYLDRLLRNSYKHLSDKTMPFSNVRRDRAHFGHSIPHESRIVDKTEPTWRLTRQSNFNDTARAWANIGAADDIISYLIPLANVNDEQNAAGFLSELRKHYSPKKTPIAERQADIQQQLADAAPIAPATPEAASPPVNEAAPNAAQQQPNTALPQTGKEEPECGFKKQLKLQQLNKFNGQIVNHLRKILEAQTPEFKANATILGRSDSTLEPFIFEADPIGFRAETLRIFNLTYPEDDRMEDLRIRISDIRYTSRDRLIGMTAEIEILARDISNFPAHEAPMRNLLNRTIWLKLQNAPEGQISNIAMSMILEPNATTLDQTFARLVNMHTHMDKHGLYKTNIRANKATTDLKPGQGPAPDGTFCEACKHNFGITYPHPMTRCYANPSKKSEKNDQWFERMWSDNNKAGTTKKPYVFADTSESPTKRTKFSL